MTTATKIRTITADEAEANAAEIHAKITEYDAFLSEANELIDAAITKEIRTGTEGESKRLEKRKVLAESELPRLRARLAAYQEILAEHQAEAAEKRRAKLREQGDELDAEEREALRGVVAGFRSFQAANNAWQQIQSRRQTFKQANGLDMADYAASALDAVDVTGVPRTLPAVFDRIHKAVVEPDSVGDRRHLQGWAEFV